MACKAACTPAVLVLLAIVVAVRALTLDKDATNDLIVAARAADESGEVAITFPGPRGSSRREELLHVKGIDDAYISLYYNKKTNKISLEALYDGHLRSVSWNLASDLQTTLTLVVTSTRVKLSVGCSELHWHAMAGEFDLLKHLAHQKVKLYHEENATIKVYSSSTAALDSINCRFGDDIIRPASLAVDEESDVEEIKDFMEKDIKWKRGEEMMGDDYRGNAIDNGILPQPTAPPRGDIPSNTIETCDDEVIRQLQFLRQTIEALRREIAEQKGTIDHLRGQLRQCCAKAPPPPQPSVERCTGSTCYPGY